VETGDRAQTETQLCSHGDSTILGGGSRSLIAVTVVNVHSLFTVSDAKVWPIDVFEQYPAGRRTLDWFHLIVISGTID